MYHIVPARVIPNRGLGPTLDLLKRSFLYSPVATPPRRAAIGYSTVSY